MKEKNTKYFKLVLITIMATGYLSGCSSKEPHKLNTEALHYEADYGALKNSFGTVSNMVEVNGGVLYFPQYNKESSSVNYTVFYDGKQSQILNSNPETICNWNHIDNCSSIFSKPAFNFTAYGDKLYYYVTAFDKDDSMNSMIMRRDFDGSNDETLLTVPEKLNDSDVAFSFTIHQNILYYVLQNELHCLDLETMKDQICIKLEENTRINQLFFEKDHVYMSVDMYKDRNGDINQNVILKTSLKDFETEVFSINKKVYYACQDFLLVLKEENGSLHTYYYDVLDKEEKKLLDTGAFSAFVNDTYIVLCDLDIKNLFLFDKNGTLLDSINCDGVLGMPQGIMNDAFYFSNSDTMTRYPMKQDQWEKPMVWSLDK